MYQLEDDQSHARQFVDRENHSLVGRRIQFRYSRIVGLLPVFDSSMRDYTSRYPGLDPS